VNDIAGGQSCMGHGNDVVFSEGSILRILVPSSSWFSSMRWIQLDLTLALQPQITSASSAPPIRTYLSQDTKKKTIT
jgi:hypothetical protein